MAATIPEAATVKVLRMTHLDVAGERVTKTVILDGATADADIATFLDSYAVLTNAAFESVKLTSEKVVTGLPTTPSNVLERNVSNQAALGFKKASPLDATAQVSRSFIIPAYISTIQDLADDSFIVDLTPTGTTTPEQLGRVINFLIANLAYKAADGTYYNGGWTWSETMSGFATVPNVIDGVS